MHGLRAGVYYSSSIFLLTLALCLAHAFAQQYPPPFPRPNADKLLENDRVIAWKVIWPKNQPTPMHEHPFDQLSVTLVGGEVKVTRLSGTPTINNSVKGSVAFTPKGTIHVEEGLSDLPQQKIMLELKPSVSSEVDMGSDSAIFVREGAVKLLENGRVIAWDFTWKAGHRVQLPVGHLDSVFVFIEPGTIRATTNQGGTKDIPRRAGEIVFISRNGKSEMEEAVQASPRAVIVELK